MIGLENINEIKSNFGKNETLFFYYPTIPNPKRDSDAIDLLNHFPNAFILFEKPSHNSLSDALAFKEKLDKVPRGRQRFGVGMHNSLHPSRKMFLD